MNRQSSDSAAAGATSSRYPGVRPFGDAPGDVARFFGRTEESEKLYLRVLSVPLLVQFGKSGLGKTSLLQAGLFPRLRQKPFLPVMVRLNAADEPLGLAVARAIQRAGAAESLELSIGPADGLWELLAGTTVWRDELLLTPVLAFDQFEEVFTLRDAAFRAELAAELGALASGKAPERLQIDRSGAAGELRTRPDVKIVISLREDYLGALEEFSAAIPGLFHERLRLEPLTEDEAREAITKPGHLIPAPGDEPYWAPRFEFEPAALDGMIAYLKGRSGVIEPFQLQLLCRHAEAIAFAKRSTPGDAVKLTPADFSGTQDFASILKNFYRDTLRKLPGSQRTKAERLCEEGLLNAAGHRLMLEEEQVRGEFGITDDTLNTLSRERLTRRERRLESVFYEISHDRLAEAILQSRRFRLPRNVRRWVWTAAFAAPVVLAGVLFWVYSLNAERERAEQLLGFLLGESFLGEVRDVGRSPMLAQVRDRAGSYVEKAGAFNHGLALRNAGDLERTQGNVAASLQLFERALLDFKSRADDPASRREAARTLDRIAQAASDQLEIKRALARQEDAIGEWQWVVSSAVPAALDDCTSLAASLIAAGDLANRMGQAEVAVKRSEDALQTAASVLFGDRAAHGECGAVAGKVTPHPDAKALEVFSQAALLREQVLYPGGNTDGAALLALEASLLRPLSALSKTNKAVAFAHSANNQLNDEALRRYRQVRNDFDELRRWDPSNRLWQGGRAATQLLVSEGIVACRQDKAAPCKPNPALEEAEAATLDAIAELGALASIDATNLSLNRDLAWAYQVYAKVLALQGRQNERLGVLQTAEQMLRKSHSDAANAEEAALLAGALVEQSGALANLGRWTEAKDTLHRSIESLSGLVAAYGANPTRIAGLHWARQRQIELQRNAGDARAADAAQREAKRLEQQYRSLLDSGEERADELNAVHVSRVNEGAALLERKDYAAALAAFLQAKAPMRDYISLRPTSSAGYDALRNIYDWIATAQEKLGDDQGRASALASAMNAARIAAVLALEDERDGLNRELYGARQKLGQFLYEQQRLDEALAVAEQGVSDADRLVQGAPGDASTQALLGDANFGLSMIRRERKEAGWEEAIRTGLIHSDKAVELDRKSADHWTWLGKQRKYLADELEAEGHADRASAEYRLALKAYREAARRAPDNEVASKAINDLVKRGSR